MEKKKDWLGIVFGTIWFLYAAFILINYLSGNLNGSFSVPRLLVAIYDIFGVVPGSIIQMVVSAIVVIFIHKHMESMCFLLSITEFTFLFC